MTNKQLDEILGAPSFGGIGNPASLNGKPLEEVVAFCRTNGIRKLRYQGVEIEFAAPIPAETSKDALQKFAEAMAGAVPSDTEFLGWSAPGEFPADLGELAQTLGIPGYETKKE